MKMMNPLKLGIVAAGVLVPGAAFAAVSAITTTDLNMRTGPSTGYEVVEVIPDGGHVTVYGCLSGYNWCDVSWHGYRGWASGNYLAYLGERYYRDPIPSIGVTIGVPIIAYHHDDYFDRWYRHRRHEIRHEIRQERREHRREVRHERREDRRAIRHERRDVRQERRDLRDARHDLRDARRHGENLKQERHRVHKEKRQLRHEKRQLHTAQHERRRDRRDD
jgi:uncharacterized protein YraI